MQIKTCNEWEFEAVLFGKCLLISSKEQFCLSFFLLPLPHYFLVDVSQFSKDLVSKCEEITGLLRSWHSLLGRRWYWNPAAWSISPLTLLFNQAMWWSLYVVVFVSFCSGSNIGTWTCVLLVIWHQTFYKAFLLNIYLKAFLYDLFPVPQL